MDADDDLQLNLAGVEQTASKFTARVKGNRHTVSFKKQQKVCWSGSIPETSKRTAYCTSAQTLVPYLLQKQKQAQRQGRQQRSFAEQDGRATATKSASAGALKGYELTASEPEAPTSIAIAQQHEQQKQQPQQPQQPPDPVANRVKAFPSRSQAGKRAPETRTQQRSYQPPGRTDTVFETTAVNDIHAKREHIARKAKRDRAAFEGELSQMLV